MSENVSESDLVLIPKKNTKGLAWKFFNLRQIKWSALLNRSMKMSIVLYH